MCEDACPVHKMVAVTCARPKMVDSNSAERNKLLFFFVLLHFTQPKRGKTSFSAIDLANKILHN